MGKAFSKLLRNNEHQSCLKSRKTCSDVKAKLSSGGLKEELYLVDISKRSLTELTLQPLAPVLSSSCSHPIEHSNQVMLGSRRRLLRNCFISIDSIEKHWMFGLITRSGLFAKPPESCKLNLLAAELVDWCNEHARLQTNLDKVERARKWPVSDYFPLFIWLPVTFLSETCLSSHFLLWFIWISHMCETQT